jgi:hypothetical protein
MKTFKQSEHCKKRRRKKTGPILMNIQKRKKRKGKREKEE